MNLGLTGGWYQRCGGFPSWNKHREGPGEVLWVGGLKCVHPRGRPLPNACVQSAVPIANREGIRTLLFNDFMNFLPPLILPAVFSLSPLICLPAPTHSMALILPLDKVISMLTRSEGGLRMCGRNYSLSHIQLTMAAASMDKSSLGQPKRWASICLPSKLLGNEKNLWAGPWRKPRKTCRIAVGLGLPPPLLYPRTE